jgi:hypothetical protein
MVRFRSNLLTARHYRAGIDDIRKDMESVSLILESFRQPL